MIKIVIIKRKKIIIVIPNGGQLLSYVFFVVVVHSIVRRRQHAVRLIRYVRTADAQAHLLSVYSHRTPSRYLEFFRENANSILRLVGLGFGPLEYESVWNATNIFLSFIFIYVMLLLLLLLVVLLLVLFSLLLLLLLLINLAGALVSGTLSCGLGLGANLFIKKCLVLFKTGSVW